MKQRIILLLLVFLATGLSAADPDYPSSYRALDLPEYENASVTGLGRDMSSLSNGIVIVLYTEDDDATLRTYYEKEMEARGWELQETVASARMRAAGVLDRQPFGAIFSKAGVHMQIFTSPQGSGRAIRINVIKEDVENAEMGSE